MKLDDLSSENSSAGANSKNMSGVNPNMVRVSWLGDSKEYTVAHMEEVSMSHGVNDTNKNNPMKDTKSPYMTNNFIGDTEVKSTTLCDNSDPTFVHNKPNSSNYGNHISPSKPK
ncbi:hypothetical protein Tco_0657757 [Tanacetum coccineum]